MIKNVEELLNKKIIWIQNFDEPSIFESNYNGRCCILRMNNFPEEPMYTLFWKEESLDMDDAPKCWTLVYRTGNVSNEESDKN